MKEGLDLMSLPKNVNTQISETITYKNDDGVPFHLKIQGTQYNFAILKNSFEFKNQQIDINKYFVHPKLLENVCKRIESNLFSKNAQREFIEAKIKSNNARTLSRESEVSMHSHI